MALQEHTWPCPCTMAWMLGIECICSICIIYSNFGKLHMQASKLWWHGGQQQCCMCIQVVSCSELAGAAECGVGP